VVGEEVEPIVKAAEVYGDAQPRIVR